MANSLAFIDELQGANYQNLSSTNFQIGIVDPDDSALTSSQISSLHASGKTLIAYLDIGEAENYRSYWSSSWNANPPSFLMGSDPNWSDNYYVKYWEPAWQQTIINDAVSMAKEGYGGIMLDNVDAYTVSSVAAADGGITNARTAMENFVEEISAATKAINPHFKIIQNNALDLLTTNPNDPTSATNTSYLSHIDGVVAESTFYNSNNSPTTWASWNAQYLEHAVAAGKTVLSIDYPSDAATQQAYIKDAVADGFVPYAADQNLDSTIPSTNYQVPGELHAGALSSLTGTSSTSSATASSTTGAVAAAPSTSSSSTPAPAVTSETSLAGYHMADAANGTTTMLGTMTHMAFAFGSGFDGNATIKYFATASGDVIDLSPNIYSTAAQALQHVTYSGSNAIVNLGGHGTITLVAAGHNSLTAADFHIG